MSPLEHLSEIKANNTKEHERRALEAKEIRLLLETTRVQPERFGMTGRESGLFCIVELALWHFALLVCQK